MRRFVNYWWPKVVGIAIVSFQVYKYVTNQMTDFFTEGCVTVVGVAFFLNLRWILGFAERKFLSKNDEQDG